MTELSLRKNNRGFTLIEVLMVLMLVGILAAVAITATTSSVNNQAFDKTVFEMTQIRNAIMGNPDESARGSRVSFGYFGDIGAMPSAIGDLIAKPGAVAAWSTDTTNRISVGWRGPYITNADPAVDYTKDGWGNAYVYSPAAVPPTLTSLGSDGAVGGTGLAQDITIQFPTTSRLATVNGFIIQTAAGDYPAGASASATIYYPDGVGGVTSTTVASAIGAKGAFSFSNIPFGVRSLTFTASTTGATVYGPVIFTVDRANYAIPITLTDTGLVSCTAKTISFTLASSSGAEAAANPRNIQLTASAACASPMSVDYTTANGTAVSGSDYTAASGTITFAAGATTANIPVTVIDDAITEPNETFTITISNPVNASLGATTTHTYTINNDDAAVCASGSTTLTANGTFTMPNNCTSLVIKGWGAGGGGGQTSSGKAGTGGPGGYVLTATISSVSPGETFTTVIGGGGRGGGGACGAGGTGAHAGGAEGIFGSGNVGGAGGGAGAGGSAGASGDASSFAGGAGKYGGGGGGSTSTVAERGGGGGGSTQVTRDSTAAVLLIAGGGGGGGASNSPGPGNAGNGGSGCGANGGNGNAGQTRGGGGGGGACTGGTGTQGAGVTPSNSAQAGAGVAVGGAAAGTCATGAGGNGAVRFEY